MTSYRAHRAEQHVRLLLLRQARHDGPDEAGHDEDRHPAEEKHQAERDGDRGEQRGRRRIGQRLQLPSHAITHDATHDTTLCTHTSCTRTMQCTTTLRCQMHMHVHGGWGVCTVRGACSSDSRSSAMTSSSTAAAMMSWPVGVLSILACLRTLSAIPIDVGASVQPTASAAWARV